MYTQSTKLIFFLILCIILSIIGYCIYTYLYLEPFDYYTCTMKLDNVDAKLIDNYMKFDNQHIACGPCKNATLKIETTSCPVDSNGSSLSTCKPSYTITSSLGNSVNYPFDITPQILSKFYCINL